MVHYDVNGTKGKFSLNLPSNLSDITNEYLAGIGATINVADNYTLIALCYREKLSTLILSVRQNKKDISAAVVPIKVKSGNTDNTFINNISIGDKIVVSPSQLSLGHHVVSPRNVLTIENILAIVDGDDDLYKDTLNSEYVYFVELKLIPNCDIVGCYNDMVNTNIAPLSSPYIEFVEDKETKD